MRQKLIKRDILNFLDYMWSSEHCDYFQCEPKERRHHIFKVMARLKIAFSTTAEAKKKVKRQLLRYL